MAASGLHLLLNNKVYPVNQRTTASSFLLFSMKKIKMETDKEVAPHALQSSFLIVKMALTPMRPKSNGKLNKYRLRKLSNKNIIITANNIFGFLHGNNCQTTTVIDLH